MAIWYVDLEGSAGSGNGTSFANRSSNLPGIVNAAANGDEVRVKQTTVSSIGTCTWTNNSTISLPAGTVKNVTACDSAWTAANANVTSTASATRKQGTAAASLAIASGFTTGKIAHFPLGSTQDFSAYNKITLWFRTNVQIANANIYYIALCSDTSGNTVVDTLTLPSLLIPVNAFIPLTIDKGSALGSSIQSVALYATSTPGAVTLLLDNIVATKNVGLNTLIGKNNGNDNWYSLRSLLNDTAEIDAGINSLVSTATSKGYPFNTETVTSYYTEGFKSTPATAATNSIYAFSKAAVAGAEVLVSGGWNSTDMSTQTGNTHVNGQNLLGRVSISGSYLIFENFIFSLIQDNWIFTSSNLTFRNLFGAQIWGAGIASSGIRAFITITNCRFSNCGSGISISSRQSVVTNCVSTNCGGASQAFLINGNFSIVNSCTAINNNDSGFYMTTNAGTYWNNCYTKRNTFGFELSASYDCQFVNCTAESNSSAAIYNATCFANFYNLTTISNTAVFNDGTANGVLFGLFNWVKNESTLFLNLQDYDGATYISINEDGTANNHVIYTDGGRIASDTTVRYTPSGISWKHQPTSASRTATYPLKQQLKGIPLKGGVTHTVSVQAQRSNTAITFNLGCPDVAMAGLTAQEATLTAAANTWQQLSLTLTPTSDVIVDFYTSSYGGTTHTAYWDDFTVVANSKNDVASGDYAYINNGAYVTSYSTTVVAPPLEYRYINLA